MKNHELATHLTLSSWLRHTVKGLSSYSSFIIPRLDGTPNSWCHPEIFPDTLAYLLWEPKAVPWSCLCSVEVKGLLEEIPLLPIISP